MSVPRFAFIGIVIAALGCRPERLTEPEARRVVAPRSYVIPDSIVIFVDGVRQPVGAKLSLRGQDVVAVQVVKDRAARARLFGTAARGGLVYIFTKNARRGMSSK